MDENPEKKEVREMSKKYAASLLALAVCLVAVSGAYAFGGFGGQGSEAMQEALEAGDYAAFVEAMSHQVSEEQFQRMAERQQNMLAEQQALEAGDYDAWVKAIESRPKITDLITEDNFPKYAEMQQAREEGDLETTQEIAEELGLNQFGFGKGPIGKHFTRGNGGMPRFKGFGNASR